MAGNSDSHFRMREFQFEDFEVKKFQGFIKYWEMRGQKGDMWVSCDNTDEAR